MKRKHSLITREFREISMNLLYIFLGSAKLWNPAHPLARTICTAMLYLGLFLTAVSFFFRFGMKYDLEDEAALAHYLKAKESVFNILRTIFLLGSIVVIFADIFATKSDFNLCTTINFWIVPIIYGCLQLAVSFYFIYLEKKEA